MSNVEWSHHCSACGKCCNSAPQLSVPELLQHQHAFFGCLGVRRIARPPSHDAAAVARFEELARLLWHRLPEQPAEQDDVFLSTQAFDPGVGRCPALDPEARCSLQDRQKPVTCRVVPLDALRPDRAQRTVLSERAVDAGQWGSDCIVPGARTGFDVITRGLEVVESGARASLREHRATLAAERKFWGDAVFQLLRRELFASPARWSGFGHDGLMTLSLAPVLMVVASASERCRARCLAYLDAQFDVARRLLEEARAEGREFDESMRRLKAFDATNRRLYASMSSQVGPSHSVPLSTRLAYEHWLGLVESSTQ